MLPNARVLDIVGRDHMLATGDRQFKAGVLAFLHERP
jgi:non-heme chloroperoxidase